MQTYLPEKVATLEMGDYRKIKDQLLVQTRTVFAGRMKQEAIHSRHHCLYSKLDHGCNSYINMNNNWLISNVMKARGGLFSLNTMPNREDRQYNCALCNLSVPEDTIHFLAICPVLAEFRKRFLGSSVLSMEGLLRCLNGECWSKLHLYIVYAWRYRKELVDEFNYF